MGLVAVTLVAWGRGLQGEFQFDDWALVVNDEATSDLGALGARLGNGVRPLLRLSFYLDHALWGMHPAGFHVTNLAVHVATVLVVLGLARRRLGEATAAFLAAAAFALQPANAEVVAYVSGRSTGLATCLILAGLLAHDRSIDRGGIARAAWEALSLCLFVLACLAKEVALIFPLLVVLWDAGRPQELGGGGVHRAWLRASLAAMAVAAFLGTSPRYRYLAGFSAGLRSPWESLLANARAVPEMLSLWIRPWALAADHAFDPAPQLPLSVLGAGFLGVLVASAVSFQRQAPLAAFAVGWTLLCLAPTNSIVAKLDLVTEKPLYLAWVGPALLLGQLGGRLITSARAPVARRRRSMALAAVLLAAGLASAARAAVWSDAQVLWRDAVVKTPHNSRAWDNLGVAYWRKDQYPEAGAAFREALRLDPSNAAARRNLHLMQTLCSPRCKEEP